MGNNNRLGPLSQLLWTEVYLNVFEFLFQYEEENEEEVRDC